MEYWCMQHVRGLGDDMLCNDSLHYIITDTARVMKDDVNYIRDREERWPSSPSVLAAESADLMCCEYTARRLPRSSVLHTQTTYTTSTTFSHPQPRHTTRPLTPQVLHSAIQNLAIHTTRDHVHHKNYIQPSTTSPSIPGDHVHHKYYIQPSTTSPSISRDHVHHKYYIQPSTTSPSIPRDYVHHKYYIQP